MEFKRGSFQVMVYTCENEKAVQDFLQRFCDRGLSSAGSAIEKDDVSLFQSQFLRNEITPLCRRVILEGVIRYYYRQPIASISIRRVLPAAEFTQYLVQTFEGAKIPSFAIFGADRTPPGKLPAGQHLSP
jgi:hypothetical protein